MKLSIVGAARAWWRRRRRVTGRSDAMGNSDIEATRHKEQGRADCRTPEPLAAGATRLGQQASGVPGCFCCCRSLAMLFRRDRRSMAPTEQNDVVETQKEGRHAPQRQGTAKCSWPVQRNAPLPPHHQTFPPSGKPAPLRLKQLVQDMCGAPLDFTDWSTPLQVSQETSPAATTTTNTTNGGEAAVRDASRTDGSGSGRSGRAPGRCIKRYQPLLPRQPAPHSVPPPDLCRRALRFVLICLWALAAYKIATDLSGAVRDIVHQAACDAPQDTERCLA